MHRNFVLILTLAGWIGSSIVLQTASEANSNATKGRSRPSCFPPGLDRRVTEVERAYAGELSGLLCVSPCCGLLPGCIPSPYHARRLDTGRVLCYNGTICEQPGGPCGPPTHHAPFGTGERNGAGSNSCARHCAKEADSHVATCGQGSLPLSLWAKGGGLATKDQRCQS
jgi:hypothetical protein